jgi:hypothetical protein
MVIRGFSFMVIWMFGVIGVKRDDLLALALTERFMSGFALGRAGNDAD